MGEARPTEIRITVPASVEGTADRPATAKRRVDGERRNMASRGGIVWAIEIGNDSLKALRLGVAGAGVAVLGFANVVYGKILAGSGVSATERDELIALGLRRFLRENSIGKDSVVIAVPSQTSFARFVNLPPVESKRIPEMVKFESVEQIPFGIDDVQ